MNDSVPPADVIRSLRSLQESLPEIDPRFVERLHGNLRVIHVSSPGEPPARVGIRAVIVGVGFAVLVVLALFLSSTGPGGPATVEILEARNVSVVLPDGTEIDARAGLRVPVGSTVAIGPDGFARFEFGVVGPDRVVVVLEDGFRTIDEGVDGAASDSRDNPPRPDTTDTTTSRAGDDGAVPADPSREGSANDVGESPGRGPGVARPSTPGTPGEPESPSDPTTTTSVEDQGGRGRS